MESSGRNRRGGGAGEMGEEVEEEEEGKRKRSIEWRRSFRRKGKKKETKNVF